MKIKLKNVFSLKMVFKIIFVLVRQGFHLSVCECRTGLTDESTGDKDPQGQFPKKYVTRLSGRGLMGVRLATDSSRRMQ